MDEEELTSYHLLLSTAKAMGNKTDESIAYKGLGCGCFGNGKFKKAIYYFREALSIYEEHRERSHVADMCYIIGVALRYLGEFKQSMDYLNRCLRIAKMDLKDKAMEGMIYGQLGIVFHSLGDVEKAFQCYSEHVTISTQLKDNVQLAIAYNCRGQWALSLHWNESARHFFELELTVAKYLEDTNLEGAAYCGLGRVFENLNDFEKAIRYHKLHLNIAQNTGDKLGEGIAYGNLGTSYYGRGDFEKSKDFYSLQLNIAKDVGDKTMEGEANNGLGENFESENLLPEALASFKSSVSVLNDVRSLLQSEDEWKIRFRNMSNSSYTSWWRVLLKQRKIVDALLAANKARAQALVDLMQSQYSYLAGEFRSRLSVEVDLNTLNSPSSNIVFLAINLNGINTWLVSKQEIVCRHQKDLNDHYSSRAFGDELENIESFIQNVWDRFGVRDDNGCEDRSMDTLRKGYFPDDESDKKRPQPPPSKENPLHPPPSKENPLVTLYDLVMRQIEDSVEGDELIFVPDGPLWLAPFAAFVKQEQKQQQQQQQQQQRDVPGQPDCKYLFESFQIRAIPSLTSLELLAACPEAAYHNRRGALLVGDPSLEEVTDENGKVIFQKLAFARKEVQMISEIVNEIPLLGKEATKHEVLKRLSSVALVHFAAHGCMKTGEIALTPNPNRRSEKPEEEDYILTMKDVLNVQEMRPKLVVLSCCHSGRGEVCAEGVVGIARAFLGAGARSVLVSLWAINDEATSYFMRSFYNHLVQGRSASESLNQARRSLKESPKYSHLKYWAPFSLIGDNVTLDFDEKK